MVGVIGRDVLISRIWRKLERESLRFTAERRVGKTTVMQEMARKPPDGVLAVFIDVEAVRSPVQFTEVLLGHVKRLLGATGKAKELFTGLLARLGGTEIGGIIKLPESGEIDWQSRLEGALDGICAHHPSQRIVLMFDELPYMLQRIAVSERAVVRAPNTALALLDVLRQKRMQHPNLRMVYSGSIGLHHVLTDLRSDRLMSQPVNDMPLQEIRGLAEQDAALLAMRHLELEGIEGNELELVAATIGEQCDFVPFYILRVVSQLAELERPVVTADVGNVVAGQLASDADPWEMEHFRTRLATYYPERIPDVRGREVASSKIVEKLLDFAATQDAPQTIDDMWGAAKSHFALDDRALVIRLLRSLAQDHYLISDDQKRYSFRYALLRRWWRLAQGLGVT